MMRIILKKIVIANFGNKSFMLDENKYPSKMLQKLQKQTG